MTKEIFASKSFGGKHSCSQEWPDNTYLQCGGKGLVISGDRTYNTAFFEVFPKNPQTFIRGEGNTIEEAEFSAWKKYQKIINCPKHSFSRVKQTETAKCSFCNLNLTNYYPPLTHCSICSKENVKNMIDSKYYCFEHYLKQIEDLNIIKNYNNIENLFIRYTFEENEYEIAENNDFYYEEYLISNYALKNNFLENIEDYQISNYLENMSYEFSSLLRKIIHHSLISDQYNGGVSYLFTLNASIMKIKSFLYNSKIIEKLLDSLFKKEDFKDYELVSNHLKNFINEYQTKMPKEDCYRIKETKNE